MKRWTNRTEKDTTLELRTVDPRTLIEDPENPRRKAQPDQADLQMAASIRAIGILQPPVVREMPDGLMIRYGHRRVRGAIAVEWSELDVLVLGETEHVDDDKLRAMIENVVRKQMSPVEQWKAIEALVQGFRTMARFANSEPAQVVRSGTNNLCCVTLATGRERIGRVSF